MISFGVGGVIDASALLAYLQDEVGGPEVEKALSAGAVMSAVNYAEVLTRLSDSGEDPALADRRLRDQGLIEGLLRIAPLSGADAVDVASLRALTRSAGLSLGDRACLATARHLGRPVVTADRSWTRVDVGVTIRTIR